MRVKIFDNACHLFNGFFRERFKEDDVWVTDFSVGQKVVDQVSSSPSDSSFVECFVRAFVDEVVGGSFISCGSVEPVPDAVLVFVHVVEGVNPFAVEMIVMNLKGEVFVAVMRVLKAWQGFGVRRGSLALEGSQEFQSHVFQVLKQPHKKVNGLDNEADHPQEQDEHPS